jgi:hypothetical protein
MRNAEVTGGAQAYAFMGESQFMEISQTMD